MKRAAVLIAGLLAIVLMGATACGGSDEEKPTTRPATAAAPATAVPPTAVPAVGVVLGIGVTGIDLKFDKDKLTASAGSEVVVTFNNGSDTLQHNWVLVKAGTKDDVAVAGLQAGPANGWVEPGDPNVIVNTALLDPAMTGEARFNAPAAGTYQFVCTFPGHTAAGMFGDFVVTS